ncbi:HAL/PAL/TAL family ammonia-lyase [Streptomyces lomondensis]|uniref:Histidine ammonia-lyase n=1 Tax=Streptomyces lomondensis TaxID=68229 RepID=A0ABQ2X6T1_9ACTN|nr:aromatic amino acid ammonia-lyase [Streptomyces lomondensis]MCF0078333.1 aromatic amino acid ammonia-lyase [Streptomyces lomondensis]GGX02144.1 histidine ammonia-lyase [Streptomyces lomondensis]
MPIYGVTTGFGDSNTEQVAAERAGGLQEHLLQFLLCGTGPCVPDEVVRATILIRANCLARGVSGVRPSVVEQLLALLEHDVLALVPEHGSVGASGDLIPLAYVAQTLTGHGDVLHRGRRTSASAALERVGLAPLALEAKEGLALVNGTSFMSALACLALGHAHLIADAAEAATALAVEVLCGNTGHYDDFLQAHKPHPGQRASAQAIRARLCGSRLAVDPVQVRTRTPDLGGRPHQHLDHDVQDRYSLRCAPHVIGVLRDTLAWAGRWLTVEINSADDNPLFDAQDVAVHSGGNFYGGHVCQAMDALKTAVASVADLLDRQLALLVDGRYNRGLPANLAPGDTGGAAEAGMNHGYKGVQIACSALTAEALRRTAPAAVFSRSTEAHNQDKVSLGTHAARDARDVTELTVAVLAHHLHAACQAADLRGPHLLSPAGRALHAAVRTVAGPLAGDRPLAGELAALARHLNHAQEPLGRPC